MRLESEERFLAKLLFSGLILLFSLLVAYLKPVGFDVDSHAYYLMTINQDVILNFEGNQEPIFKLIRAALFIITDDLYRALLVTYMFLAISLKLYLVQRFSRCYAISIFAYISIYFLLHDVIQMRAALAAAVFMWSLPDLAEKNRRYIYKIALASICHYSSLFLFPLYLLNFGKIKKTNYYFFYILTLIISSQYNIILDLATNISGILPGVFGYKAQRYLVLINQDVHTSYNLLNIYNLSLIFISLILIWKSSDQYSNFDNMIVKVLAVSNYIYITMSAIPVLAARVSELMAITVVFALAIIYHFSRFKLLTMVIIMGYLSCVFYINYFLKTYINTDLIKGFYFL
ncbi:EpsG family protein [Vibrio cyclitrophicus]